MHSWIGNGMEVKGLASERRKKELVNGSDATMTRHEKIGLILGQTEKAVLRRIENPGAICPG